MRENGNGGDVCSDLGSLTLHTATSLNSPGKASGVSPSYSTGRRLHRNEPFFIGVAGGTASGKTTVCDQIMQRLHGTIYWRSKARHKVERVNTISQCSVDDCRPVCCHAVPRLFLQRTDSGGKGQCAG